LNHIDERNLGSGRQESYIFKVDEIQSYGIQHFLFFTGNAFNFIGNALNNKIKELSHEVFK
jgi:hypothetical protein